MRSCPPFLLLLIAASALTACDVNGDVTATQGAAANTINGSVHVPAGVHGGAVGTVNGGIRIDDNAVVTKAETVNGAITVAAHASAGSVETVNGAVTLGDGARVTHGVTTVNGAIQLESGADVGGKLQNVNGQITLASAHVGGGLRTVDGDIDISGESRVEGGILVEPSNNALFGAPSPHKPRIVIGAGAVVQGDLRFERDVLLYVNDKATVGPITGATAIRYSGDKPAG